MFSNLIEVLSLNIFNRMSVNETRLINNGESKFYNHCKQVSTRTRSCGVVHHPGPAPPHYSFTLSIVNVTFPEHLHFLYQSTRLLGSPFYEKFKINQMKGAE